MRLRGQAAWNRSTRRAGDRGGACAGKCRWVRIFMITAGSTIAAMIFTVCAVFDIEIEYALEQAGPAHAPARRAGLGVVIASPHGR